MAAQPASHVLGQYRVAFSLRSALTEVQIWAPIFAALHVCTLPIPSVFMYTASALSSSSHSSQRVPVKPPLHLHEPAKLVTMAYLEPCALLVQAPAHTQRPQDKTRRQTTAECGEAMDYRSAVQSCRWGQAYRRRFEEGAAATHSPAFKHGQPSQHHANTLHRRCAHGRNTKDLRVHVHHAQAARCERLCRTCHVGPQNLDQDGTSGNLYACP